MSLIGTMFKEPRVFVHDAYNLSRLYSKYGELTAFAGLTIFSAGSGYFPAGLALTDVRTQGGHGGGLTVDITTNAAGGVTAATVNQQGEGYLPNDIVSIDASFGGIETGTGNGNATIQIQPADLVAATAWALGDPLTIMPYEKTSISYFKEKSSYTYEFGGTTFENPGPPAGIYVGVDMDLTVILENPIDAYTGVPDKQIEFTGLKGGTFYPLSVLTVTAQSAGGLADIIAVW